MDLHHLFATPILLSSQDTDFDKEWDRMIAREAAIQEFELALINGSLSNGSIEHLADMLAEHEIEPYDYLNMLEHNIKHVLNNNIILEFD